MTYGLTASAEDSDAKFHVPDDRGSNEPFHPISRCGLVLTRNLVDQVPEGSDTCERCVPPTARSSKSSE